MEHGLLSATALNQPRAAPVPRGSPRGAPTSTRAQRGPRPRARARAHAHAPRPFARSRPSYELGPAASPSSRSTSTHHSHGPYVRSLSTHATLPTSFLSVSRATWCRYAE